MPRADIIRYMAKYKNSMGRVMSVFKALADENRVRALAVLVDSGELCVCQIKEFLGLAPSTVSKHLSILTQAGLVASRKKGRWVYYRPVEGADGVVQEAYDFLERTLGDDATVGEDIRTLKKICKMDPEALCQIQKAR